MLYSQGDKTEYLKLLSAYEINEHFKVTHNGIELEPRGATRTVNGSLYKSNMTKFEVEVFGSHDLIGKELNIQRGLSHPDIDNGTIHWVDYGNFIVEENEFDTLEEVTTLQASDYMIKSQVPYKKEDMALTFPKTAGEVFKRVLEVIGVETSTTTFRNDDVELGYDLWADTSYTYRDVLDHIAELSSSIISVKDNKIEITEPVETGFKLDINKMKQIDLGDTYGPTNIVNITQEPQHSNTPYPKNWTEIPVADRKELVFQNNPIFDTNQERYGELVYPQVKDLTYKEIKSETFGYGIFEIGDIVEVPDPQTGDTFKTVLSFEETDFGTFPHSEQRFEKPIQAQDDYVVETDERRIAQETYILVDKANGNISLTNEKVADLSESVSQIEINMDEILLLLEQRNSTNLWINSSGVMGVDTYTFDVEPIKMNDEDYPMIMDMTDYTMGRQDDLFKAIPYPSLAENAFSIDREGTATSSKKYLVFDEDLYFHVKIKGNPHNKNYVGFKLLEYDKDKTRINVQDLGEHTPTRDMYHFKKKVTPRVETEYVAIEIRGRGTALNPVIITEGMLSYTDYAPYDISSNDVLEYTKSQIKLLEGEIDLYTEIVDGVENDIHSAGVNIDALTGVSVLGKFFNIYDENKNRKLYYDTQKEELVMNGFLEAKTHYGSTKFTDSGILFNKQDNEVAKFHLTNEQSPIDGNYYDLVDFHTIQRERAGFQFMVGDDPKLLLTNDHTAMYGHNMSVNGENGINVSSPSVFINGMNQATISGQSVLLDSGQVTVANDLHAKGNVSGANINGVRVSALGVTADSIDPSGKFSNIGSNSGRFNKIYLQLQPDVSSSRKLKKDFKEINPQFLLSLNPLEYQLKNGDDKKHMGFIAEDVLEVVGDNSAVTSGESIAYGELIAPLVKLVQEQNKRIDELEKIIKEMI